MPVMHAHWDFDVGAVGVRFRKAVRDKAIARTQEFYDGVVKNSPVYTGQFRASWNISEGAPNFDTVDSGGGPGSPLPPPRQIAQSDKEFPIFFVSNGKPYAHVLEYGNEKQAPAAPVRITMQGMSR